MRRARFLPPIACLLIFPPALRAQWQLSADVGASHLQRSDIAQSGAATVGGTATNIGDHGWFRSSLLGVVSAANQFTGQALVAGSISGSPQRPARGELTGVLSAFSESGARATLSGELMPRAQFGSASRGTAIGVGFGATTHAGFHSAIYHAAADGWSVVRDNQLALSASAVRTTVTLLSGSAAFTMPQSYLDLTGAWRRDHGGVAFGATAGARSGLRSTSAGAWGALDATVWLLPRAAIVASAGRSLEDPVRGVPRTTFFGLAVRVTGQSHPTLRRRREVAGARVTVQRVDATRRRIEVRGVTASRVELMGDFTNWTPVALDAFADGWRLESVMTPGLHRLALRIDGGEWTAPVNLPHTTDDLGGVFGLITVP